MPQLTWDHIHLRSPDPEATAQWFERMLSAEVIRSVQQGKPRIDLELGGAKIFIAPVVAGDSVNPPPQTPYRGLDHFAFFVPTIAELEAAWEWAGQNRLDIVHPLRHHRDGSISFYIRDPDGNVVQLLYEPAISPKRFD